MTALYMALVMDIMDGRGLNSKVNQHCITCIFKLGTCGWHAPGFFKLIWCRRLCVCLLLLLLLCVCVCLCVCACACVPTPEAINN